MTGALAARGIPVWDLLPVFREGNDAASLYRYGDGIHLSVLGHRVVVDALVAGLMVERRAAE